MTVTKQINVEDARTVKPSNGELIGSGLPEHASCFHVGKRGTLSLDASKIVVPSRTRAVTVYGGKLVMDGQPANAKLPNLGGWYSSYDSLGMLCQLDMCQRATIRNYVQKKRTNDYALYLGNWEVSLATGGKDDGIARNVLVENCDFSKGSRDEAAVRCMGMHGKFRLCTFGNPDNAQKKECFQPRHEHIVVENCTMLHSVSCGNLAPSVDGGKHARWAEANPTDLHFSGGTQFGYMKVAGNCRVAVTGLTVAGNDPRGVGGQHPFYLESHTIDGVKLQAVCVLVGVAAVGNWSAIAGPGVIVGPGCSLNGKAVKVSSNYSESLLMNIIDEANNWA